MVVYFLRNERKRVGLNSKKKSGQLSFYQCAVKFPWKTILTGPLKWTLLNEFLEGLKLTAKSPPRVLMLTGKLKPFLRNAAIEAAVTPVPQDNVSSSTPRS